MTPLELLYYIGYSIDRRLKLKGQNRLPYPVISIGNITVGGTGKTPATIAIAEEAKKRGFYPVILTRGYKGKAKGPCFVSAPSVERQASSVENHKVDAQRTTHNASRFFGDEPVLMAERLKDVPIVKCADRYEGGMFAIENFKSQISNPKSPVVFILDDGFQHRRLHRDKDIVLIDGSNPFGNRKILPIGPLREPLKELERADVFVVTKAKNEALAGELKKINPSASVYFSEYKILKLRNASGEEFPVEMLKDKRVYAFCGIANPESFRQTVLSISRELKGFRSYRDHYRYTETDVLYLEKQCRNLNCEFLVTTEKDMVKIREIESRIKGQGSENLKALGKILCLEIGFYVDEDFFDYIFTTA